MTPATTAVLRSKWFWLALVIVVVLGVSHFLTLGELVRYENNEVYLTRYASIVTSGGVYGFAPGTKFIVDPAHHSLPDKVFVTDGTHELAIEPDALTRNPERARALATSDQQVQVSSATAIIAERARIKKAENDAQLSRARDIDRLNAQQRTGNPLALPSPTVLPTTPARTPPRFH